MHSSNRAGSEVFKHDPVGFEVVGGDQLRIVKAGGQQDDRPLLAALAQLS